MTKNILLRVVFLILLFASISYAEDLKIIVGLKNHEVNLSNQLRNISGIIKYKKISGSNIIILKAKSEYINDILEDLNRLAWIKFIEISKKQRFNSINYANIDELQTSNWYTEISGDKIVSIANGRKVVVAVIDSGIDLNNPILKTHIYTNRREIDGDNIDNDDNGFIDDFMGWDFGDNDNNVQDEFGHGTEISSIILSLSKDSYILPIKINPAGADFFETDVLIEAIYYAISMEAKIINLSISMQDQSLGVLQAIKDAYSRGIVVVTAAGNNPLHIAFPATMNETIAVGSIYNNEKASFSPEGDELDVVAPGVNIETISINGDTTYVSGTSFSTAMVSAECANIISMNQNFSNIDIKNIIEQGTIDLGEAGRDTEFGFGKIDGKKLYSILTPEIILPDHPFYAFSKELPVPVSIKIPITTFSFLYIAVQTPDNNFFLLTPDGWTDITGGIKPFIQLYPISYPCNYPLFGENGIFPALDISMLPSGLYRWWIMIGDNTFDILSPISSTYMLIF